MEVKHGALSDMRLDAVVWQWPNARPWKDVLARGLTYEPDDPVVISSLHRCISSKGNDLFAKLLGNFMQYKSEGRPSTKEALEHPRFKLSTS